jgi:predicted transcriptional regulator
VEKRIKLNAQRVIRDAASKIAPGKTPYFAEPHVVKALNVISTESHVGRIGLARKLGLGEGSIRTLAKHLENEGLVETSRQGIALTALGRRFVSRLRSEMSSPIEISKSSLTVGAFNIAILVKNASKAVRAGLEQRDAAIRVGAQGATTLVFSRQRLIMPSAEEDVFKSLPRIRKELDSQLKPHENDVIVIGSAGDKLTAEYGAIAAALETLKSLQGK